MEQPNLFTEQAPCHLKHNFSFLETRLVDLLYSHKGHEGAIPREKLSSLLGISDRKLRAMLAVLVNEKECPIGSTLKPRPGYFWIITVSELAQEVGPLRSRASELQKRANSLVNTFEKENGVTVKSDLKRTV